MSKTSAVKIIGANCSEGMGNVLRNLQKVSTTRPNVPAPTGLLNSKNGFCTVTPKAQLATFPQLPAPKLMLNA